MEILRDASALDELVQQYGVEPTYEMHPLSERDFTTREDRYAYEGYRGAAAFILWQCDGTIPIVERMGSHPGYAFASGRVEKDEDFAKAASREAGEELGITIDSASFGLLVLKNRLYFTESGRSLSAIAAVFAAEVPDRQRARQTAQATREQLRVINCVPDELPGPLLFGDDTHLNVAHMRRQGHYLPPSRLAS